MQWFLEGGVLPRLLPLLSPASTPVEATKALLALSGLIRHYPAGLQAFRDAQGLESLVRLLGPSENSSSTPQQPEAQESGGSSSDSGTDPRVLRKALNVLQYVCSCSGADCAAMAAQLPRLLSLLESDDADVREGALRVLLELGASSSSWPALVDPKSGVAAALSALHASHSALSGEDLESVADEVELRGQLADVLAGPAPVNSCSNEREVLAETAAAAASAAASIASAAAAAAAYAQKKAAEAAGEASACESSSEGATAGQPEGTVYVNGVAVGGGGDDLHESYGSMQLGLSVTGADIM